MESVILNLSESTSFSDDELLELCEANDWLRIERNKMGQLVIMSPSGSFTANIHMKVYRELLRWMDKHEELGYSFDSSAGFRLPDSSVLAADFAFVYKQKWEALTREQQEKFAPVCPDFIIEVRSKTDGLKQAKSKMQDWIDNGCRLAWLIDPTKQMAYVYVPNESPITKSFLEELNGLDVMPGLSLNLKLLK